MRFGFAAGCAAVALPRRPAEEISQGFVSAWLCPKSSICVSEPDFAAQRPMILGRRFNAGPGGVSGPRRVASLEPLINSVVAARRPGFCLPDPALKRRAKFRLPLHGATVVPKNANPSKILLNQSYQHHISGTGFREAERKGK